VPKSLREIAEQAKAQYHSEVDQTAQLREQLEAVYELVSGKEFRLRTSGYPEEREHFIFCFDRRRWNATLALTTRDFSEEEECAGLELIAPDWENFSRIYEEGLRSDVTARVDFTDTVLVYNLYRGVSLVLRVTDKGYSVTRYQGSTESVADYTTMAALEKGLEPYLKK
jgi:hypothetical protein